MCLDYITNRKPRTTGVGWKVFFAEYGKPRKLFGQFCGELKVRPRRRWLKEEAFRGYFSVSCMIGIGKERYLTGWHIYTRKDDAIPSVHEKVKKVHYRKATCRGFQGKRKVVVAKEIWIC